MKKSILLFAVMYSIILFTAPLHKNDIAIINYSAAYKDAVFSLVFKDPKRSLLGYFAVAAGLANEELFITENKKSLEERLQSTSAMHKLVIIKKTKELIGFCSLEKTKAISIEKLKRTATENNMPFQEEVAAILMPNIKKTEAETEEYAQMYIVVCNEKDYGVQYGKNLIESTIKSAKKAWPSISYAKLDIFAKEDASLYESIHFKKSMPQPAYCTYTQTNEYIKQIK